MKCEQMSLLQVYTVALTFDAVKERLGDLLLEARLIRIRCNQAIRPPARSRRSLDRTAL